jgi:transposase
MSPKTGPIPRELFEPALYSSGMTAQDSRALLRNCKWQALTSRKSQVIFPSEFGETDTAFRLTTDDIAMIFNISADNVRQIRHRARMKKKKSHRPLALDPDQEADIVRFIRERFGSQNYATQRDVLNYVEERFNKTLIYGWMKRFLDRHKSEVSGVTVAPQEKVRLEVLRCYLEEYLTLIKKIVLIVLTELLFNLDETGLSEWENQRSKPVLVPTQEQESTLHYPVD